MFESASWLVTRGETDRAVATLKRIAAINGKEVPEHIYQNFQDFARKTQQEARSRERPHLFSLLKTPRLRRNILLTTISWMLTLTLMDGHVRNVVNLNYDIYSSFTILSGVRLPAGLISIFLLHNLGRRFTVAGSHVAASVCLIICVAFAGSESSLPLVILALTGKFFVAVTLTAGNQLTFEMIPTVLRAQGGAMATALGMALSFCAPYIAYSSILDPSLPFYILSAGGLIVAAITVCLPETGISNLPNTLEEGEQFGKGQPFLYLPFLERRKKSAK